MSARAVIFLGDGKASLAIPVEAVITESPEKDKIKRYVWINNNGVAQKTLITTGLSDDRWESVASGLKLGQSIIIGPSKILRQLKEGERVMNKKSQDPTNISIKLSAD